MWLRSLNLLGRGLQKIEELILATSVLVIATLTIANVVCRSVFGFSVAATEEISQFAIIVLCFVGLSYAAGRGRHIRMTAVYDQLGHRTRKFLMIFITASTSCLMFVLSFFAARYVGTVYELGGVYPALRIPFYVVYAIAPVGLGLAGMQYALAAFRNLTSHEIFLSYEVPDEYETVIKEEI